MESGTDIKSELGKGVNLPTINLLDDDFSENQRSIFESFPSECIKTKKLQTTRNSPFDSYETVKDFYSKVGTEANLKAQLHSTYTLSTTLSSITSHLDKKLVGHRLLISNSIEKIFVNKDCFNDKNKAKLSKGFVQTFEALPLKIQTPWKDISWRIYNDFLNNYGSHVITSVTRGSSIKLFVFAKGSESYKKRDYLARLCTSIVKPPKDYQELDIEQCKSLTKKEIERGNAIDVKNVKSVLQGGITATRNKLETRRTAKQIEKFLNEADKADSPTEYTFTSIWNILKNRFKQGNNYCRAVNLMYYFHGFLNFGCQLKESPGVVLQKFDYTASSTENDPEFSCTLAKEGCHKKRDCVNTGGDSCTCRGESCVRYRTVEHDTGVFKPTAYAYIEDKPWKNKGCYLEGRGQCTCKNEDLGQRKTVWPKPPSRDFVKKGESGDLLHKPDKNEVGEDDPNSGVQGSPQEGNNQFLSSDQSGNDAV